MMVMIMAKVKQNAIYFLGAVALATAFFMHETIASEPDAVVESREAWQIAKDKRTAALDALKDAMVGTELYNAYKLEADATDVAYDKLNAAKADAEFLGFKSVQQFLGEFGWCLGLFLYAMINIIGTIKRKSSFYFGELFFHTSLIFISLFFVRWCFNPAQDLAEIDYILANILIAVTVVIAMYFYIANQNKLIRGLKANIRVLTHALSIGVRPFIKESKKDSYVKFYINTIKKLQ